MKYIAVYCGSASGYDEIFTKEAYGMGQIIAEKGYGIVYGGGHVGLMGEVANGALSRGGEVIGVIPEFLKKKELNHKGLSKMYVVETMHERKAMMCELCDAVIALPGGFGTLDELFEMLTWGELAIHKKAVGLLNTKNYYQPLVDMTTTMIQNGFLKEEYRDMLQVESDAEKLIQRLEEYKAPLNDKWFQPVATQTK